MIDQDISAAARFYWEVNQWSRNAKFWRENIIRHEILPDERLDITKISERVYGNRYEILCIMAAGNMYLMTEELKGFYLILPPPITLEDIKRRTGFESQPDQRENFAPIWK